MTLFDTPIDVGRDEAQELAQRELAEKVYADAQPSWWERASSWVWDEFNELLGKAGGAVDGIGWLLVLILVVIAIIVVIALRAGTIERRHRRASTVVFGDQTVTAAEHRAQAEQAAQRGMWSEAVVEAFRALVRQIEERSALDERPGRTADEAARDASRRFPALQNQLLAAARTFDEVAYSDREGTAEGYWQVREVDDAGRATKQVAVR